MKFSKFNLLGLYSVLLVFSLAFSDHGFKMLSKGVSPPSMPNKKPNVPPHSPLPLLTHHTNLNFKMLRKGVHVPTSEPNPRNRFLLHLHQHIEHIGTTKKNL